MKKKPKASSKEPIPLLGADTEPPSDRLAAQDDFARALQTGDAAAAAEALRKLDELDRPMLDVLAALIDGAPGYGDMYPYRLKLVPWRRGRPPVDSLTKEVKEQAIARAVASALDKFGNLESALTHMQHQLNMSRSAILKRWAKRKK